MPTTETPATKSASVLEWWDLADAQIYDAAKTAVRHQLRQLPGNTEVGLAWVDPSVRVPDLSNHGPWADVHRRTEKLVVVVAEPIIVSTKSVVRLKGELRVPVPTVGAGSDSWGRSSYDAIPFESLVSLSQDGIVEVAVPVRIPRRLTGSLLAARSKGQDLPRSTWPEGVVTVTVRVAGRMTATAADMHLRRTFTADSDHLARRLHAMTTWPEVIEHRSRPGSEERHHAIVGYLRSSFGSMCQTDRCPRNPVDASVVMNAKRIANAAAVANGEATVGGRATDPDAVIKVSLDAPGTDDSDSLAERVTEQNALFPQLAASKVEDWAREFGRSIEPSDDGKDTMVEAALACLRRGGLVIALAS